MTITGQNENGRGVADTSTNLIQNILRQLAAAGITRRRVTLALKDGVAWICYRLRCTLVRYYVSVWLVNLSEGSLRSSGVRTTCSGLHLLSTGLSLLVCGKIILTRLYRYVLTGRDL